MGNLGKLVLIVFAIVMAYVIFQSFAKRFQFLEKEDEFLRGGLNGVIISVRKQTHGICKLVIRNEIGDTLDYSLSICEAIRDYNIEAGDSISKMPGSYSVVFFKKSEEGYGEPNVYKYR